MPGKDKKPVIVIVGPTASGKSDAAALLASRCGGEVVSADSMQIYRGMDIGTGKMPPEQRLVPHYGLDIVDPGEAYSASLFQAYARSCFDDIRSRGAMPVLAGGTGFYVRAAGDDYNFLQGEQVGNDVRERYQAIADQQGPEALWEMLRKRDPESAEIIHPNNVKRVIRAFEMLELDGTTYAEQHAGLKSIAMYEDACFFGLNVDRDVLIERIDRRVDRMFEAGLVDEVKGLCEQGFREACTARDAIGYKEVVAALDGACTMDEAREAIKVATRRYAKRQRSWWRNDSRITWIDADGGNVERIVGEMEDLLRGKGVL